MDMFQTQLNKMVMWFDQWSESGQTVALFKMLTRLAPIRARFLSIALDYSLTECVELALQEKEANNPGFVKGLLSESKDVAMTQLLLHLPLLQPANHEAKHCYMAVIVKMLNYSMETGCFVEEARQLLACVLIHPALREDRRTFEPWRRSLGEKIMNGTKNVGCGGNTVISGGLGSGMGTGCGMGTPVGSPSIGSFGSNGSCVIQLPHSTSPSSQQNKQRSNSLTPPFGVTPPTELTTTEDDMSVVRGKNRRFSLSDHSGGPPLSPQSQTSSGSGSETHLDDLKFPHGYNSPGMQHVQSWLKSLRLHKYSRLFSQLTYEQMMSLSEDTFESTLEQVEAGSVTQGARRKIILSVAKLRERYANLCQLEQDVIRGGDLYNTMDILRGILMTPIRPAYDDESVSDVGNNSPTAVDDIPAQFTKVLGKVCIQLTVCGKGDEETIPHFLALLDKAAHHDAFTKQQKRKIASWQIQIQQQRQMRPDQHKRFNQSVFLKPSLVPRAPGSRYPPCMISPTNAPGNRHFNRNSNTLSSAATSPTSIGTSNVTGLTSPSAGTPCTTSGTIGSGMNAANVFHSKRPSLQDHPLLELGGESHANVQRTQSAPETDPDLNSRLESLCLQMTEQALGGASEIWGNKNWQPLVGQFYKF